MQKFNTLYEADKWCKESGHYHKITFVNTRQIRTLIENAEIYINTADLVAESIDKEDPRWMTVYVNYYEALRIYVEAFLLFSNIKIKNHICLFAFLCKNYPKFGLDWNFFESVRIKRNGINFYGDHVFYNDWKAVELQFKLCISALRKGIEERLFQV